MAAVVKEPAPRIVSPVLLVLAGLCFLLPFAGVSCNTSAVTAELGSLSSISQQLGGQGSVSMPAGLSGCITSLNNYNLATYSGLDLTTGSAPNAAGSAPSGCSALTREEGSSSSIPTSADAGQLGLGAQPLPLVALVAMLLGLLLSLTRFILRGLLVAVAAAVAMQSPRCRQAGRLLLADSDHERRGCAASETAARVTDGMAVLHARWDPGVAAAS